VNGWNVQGGGGGGSEEFSEVNQKDVKMDSLGSLKLGIMAIGWSQKGQGTSGSD
jgi:hypothetical protein